jgi:hypothetical protein
MALVVPRSSIGCESGEGDNNSTKLSVAGAQGETTAGFLDEWFDPIEAGLRDRVREFIQRMIGMGELEAVLSRPRCARQPKKRAENDGAGGPPGMVTDRALRTFGRVEIAVPRARLDIADGRITEWKSKALRAYQRRTKQADSLIAGAYLAGTNTRACRGVWRRGWQRYGEPGVAEGESRLGCLECPLARRGTDRPPDPRRHEAGSTARPPRSCCWSCSACARTTRRCC